VAESFLEEEGVFGFRKEGSVEKEEWIFERAEEIRRRLSKRVNLCIRGKLDLL